MKRHALLLGAVALLLAGCDTPDRAIFVTSTAIGVNADTTTRVVNLGYDRTEGFIGPDYVNDGAAPSAVGYLQSNLEVFAPKIKQLYATGRAAELVTMDKLPTEQEQTDALTGPRRILLFGTSSNVGFKLGFSSAAGLPDSVVLGYKRKEASIIPFTAQDPVNGTQDKYASVLASIDMDQTTETLPTSNLKLTQFVATGMAARNLARDDKIRDLFHSQAAEALLQGASDAQKIRKTATDLVACVTDPTGALDSERLGTVLGGAVAAGKITPAQQSTLGGAKTLSKLRTLLLFDDGAAKSLKQYVQTNNVCAG